MVNSRKIKFDKFLYIFYDNFTFTRTEYFIYVNYLISYLIY